MTWSKKDIATVQKIVGPHFPAPAGSHAKAAEAVGTTVSAVRNLLARLRAGAEPQPEADDSTLKDALSRYEQALELRAESSKIKTLERDLHNMRSALDVVSELASRPVVPIARREFVSGIREATAIAMLSDVHCEETVRLGETPVANEYNPKIAERSIARFFAGLRWKIDLYRPAFKIRDVICWLGGDLMSGHIHEELKETTTGSPIETLLWLRPRLMAGIDSLLEDSKLERLVIPCSYGNHGRNTVKPYRARGAAHSYEWLLYQILADAYKDNPRVQFLADPSAHQYVHAYDFDLHFHHGDETNYQGGVGGVMIPLNKATSQWDKAKKCHYHHFGHWHQYINTGRLTVNGSVIGFNAYAMSIKAEPEEPAQAFYLLDSKRGKTCKSPIWVRDSDESKKKAAA